MLAVGQAVLKMTRSLLTATIGQLGETDFDAQLFGDFARGLLGSFAETPVTGGRGVPATGKGVFAQGAPLEHDLVAVVSHDPTVERLVPVAVEVHRGT